MGEGFNRIAGIIARWVLATLACWWFFWFITLIGASSDNAHELAGYALGKATICGAVAAFWFYKAKQGKRSAAERALVRTNITSRNSVLRQESTPAEQLHQASGSASPKGALAPQESSSSPELPESASSSPSEPKELYWFLAPLALVVPIIVFFIVAASIRTNATSNIASPPANESGISAQTSPVTCPIGLPAGVHVVPISDLSTIGGSDGKVTSISESSEDVHWTFSFKASNQTALTQPNGNFDGYCITAIQVEADLQATNGEAWKLIGKQTLGSDYFYLSPGWSQELTRVDLSPDTKSIGDLTNWKITKAWGFPLNSADAPKQ